MRTPEMGNTQLTKEVPFTASANAEQERLKVVVGRWTLVADREAHRGQTPGNEQYESSGLGVYQCRMKSDGILNRREWDTTENEKLRQKKYGTGKLSSGRKIVAPAIFCAQAGKGENFWCQQPKRGRKRWWKLVRAAGSTGRQANPLSRKTIPHWRESSTWCLIWNHTCENQVGNRWSAGRKKNTAYEKSRPRRHAWAGTPAAVKIRSSCALKTDLAGKSKNESSETEKGQIR
jgi:hypothetical protein